MAFSVPGLLILSTWAAEERRYLRSFLERVRAAGYTKYVEPSVLGFAMPLVAVDAGWKPSQITTTDTHLFPSIVGTVAAGRSVATLGIRLDGELLQFRSDDPIDQAAEALHVQHAARMDTHDGSVPYWATMQAMLRQQYNEQVDALVPQVRTMVDRVKGAKYRAESIWTTLDQVKRDPKVVVVSNPPTYKAAYEKFFDTGGRLTWDQPDYEPFHAAADIRRMVEVMEGQKALLLVQQQQTPRNSAHPQPVYARQLSAGQIVYLNSNRPDEVKDLMGGLTAVHRKGATEEKRKWPILPPDYEVTADTQIAVAPVPARQADAYRALWMHRLIPSPGSNNVMVWLDGMAAGVIGYSLASMQTSYSDKWANHVILRFAFGAKHDRLRLTRLATMIALQQSTLTATTEDKSAVYSEAAKGLVTTEYTRHPESKGLRGLMQRSTREPHPDGYKLTYAADWAKPATPAEVLADFITKEHQWQAASKQPTPALSPSATAST